MAQESSYFSCITLATFNTAGLAGTYATLNSTGFSDDIKILKMYNGSTVGVTISYDNGTTDHDFIPSGGVFILDLQTNHADNSSNGSGTLCGRKGQVVMGKGSAGVGTFYISAYR